MHISELSIRRPIAVLMFFLAVVLIGYISLTNLSIDLLPDLSYPKLTIITTYQGASPEEIESFVTAPLEESASAVSGIRNIHSISRESISILTLEFAWGTDMNFAALHVREKLDNVRHYLPQGAEKPAILHWDPQSKPIMTVAVAGRKDLLDLTNLSRDVFKPRMEQIKGVASAEIAGGVEREIHIEIVNKMLDLYHLDIDEVDRRIEESNYNFQGGTIRKGKYRYALRTIGQFQDIDEIKQVIIGRGKENAIIRLGDIARIYDAAKEQQSTTRLNKENSVGLLIYKEAGSNTVKVSEEAERVLAELKREYPQVNLVIAYEEARFIRNAIQSVIKSIIYGGLLAFLVLFLFLQDFRTPFIIAVSIPISIIAAFNLLYFSGISLNIMSLSGLALGVGMLVDNSIVVLENIFRHKKSGEKAVNASFMGAKEVGMAVTASTLTTVCVFLPIVYVKGVAGELFEDQALTVTFSLLASLIVALTLLPMLASRILRTGEYKPENDIKQSSAQPSSENHNKGKHTGRKPSSCRGWRRVLAAIFFPFKIAYAVLSFLLEILLNSITWLIDFLYSFITQIVFFWLSCLSRLFRPLFDAVFKGFDYIYRNFEEAYHRFLLYSLKNKGKVLMSALMLFLLCIAGSFLIKRELMPSVDSGQFIIKVKMPPGSTLEATQEIVARLEDELLSINMVNLVFSNIGLVQQTQAFGEGAISTNTAELKVQFLRSKSKQSNLAFDKEIKLNSTEKIINYLRQKTSKLAGAEISFEPEQTALEQVISSGGRGVYVKIAGDDLQKCKIIADDLVEAIKNIPGIAEISTNLDEGKPEIKLWVKRNEAEKYDLSVQQVGNYIEGIMQGRIPTQYEEFDKKVDIRMRLQEQDREAIADILNSSYPLGNGAQVPLRSLVEFEYMKGPQEIYRESQQRQVVISGSLRGKKISEVTPEIERIINAQDIPEGYRISMGGEEEELRRSFKSLYFAFVVAIILVYMIMAAQFESLVHPFTILFALPLGLIGVVIMLLLFRQSLNVISVIGVVVLTGIVVNDAIIKVDCINQLRKKGMPRFDAIIKGSHLRLRPILMTTATTVLGLTPMAIGIGEGAELQRPLALTIIGGLSFATLLTLIIIPIIYDILEGIRHK
jgi:HAE1 family hydrophobic/amphiphilic exporter-1